METWQKEIEYIEYLFFKGNLFSKYRGDINSFLSEKDQSGAEYIDLDIFYDMSIDQVEKIEESTYKKNEKLIRVQKFNGKIEADYNNFKYDLVPNELFLVNRVDPEHEQSEDGQVHGTLVDQAIVFMLTRKKKRIVCIPGAIVSSELLENGDRKEIYIADTETCEQKERIVRKKCIPGTLTGEKKVEDGYKWAKYITNEHCDTDWKIIGEFCQQDAPTGRSKIEYGWYHEEFTNEDCSTYWRKIRKVCSPRARTGNERTVNGIFEYEVFKNDCSTMWISEGKCIEGEWTGNKEERDGWVWREYTHADCTTYWKKYSQPASCFENLIWIILAFLGLGIILGLIISEGFRTIISGLFIMGIVYGLFLLVVYLFVRFSSFFQALFKYLLTILSILFILWVLYSIGNGIKNWKPREKISERTERIQQETESQVNPIILEEENEEQKISDSLEVQLKWVSFDQEIYKGSYRAHKQDIFDSKAAHNRLKYAGIQEIGEVYSYAYVNDQDKLTSLYRMLDQIRSQNNLGELEFAELVVSMVQSLEYTLIVDENCDALSLTGNREIRRLLNDFSCESPHAFGLKTPLEFLTTLKGDCDTRTVALYTILKHFGYDVAIMNSDVYQHSMLGIHLPGVRGKFKVEKGKKYLFWETTSPQSPIGFLPPDFGVINNWYIVLN